MKTLTRYQPYVLSLLRMVAAYVFMLHGTVKMFGWPSEPRAPFELFTMNGVAGVLEVFGGLLLFLGLGTRPVAFLLAGQMAVAYFTVHARNGSALLPIENGGESPVLLCFIFLYFVLAGPGAWALDNLLGRRTSLQLQPDRA